MIKFQIKTIVIIVIFTLIDLSAVIKFNSQDSTLKLGSGGIIWAAAPINISGTLKIDTKTDDSLLQAQVNESFVFSFPDTTNNLLTFSKGIYQDSSGGQALLNGTINPLVNDTIILDSGQTLIAKSETFLESIEIRGSGNIVKGQPVFSSDILLQNSSAVLGLGIQNKLTQNVTMNGGAIILLDDLSLQTGKIFSGNGIIDLNNKKLSLSSLVTAPWTGNLTFNNANDIFITGDTVLNGQWTFEGSGTTSRINGNGCILDLSAGGEIVVGSNHTLFLSDIHIKGLGSGHGNLSFGSSTSHVKLSNVTISLDGNYSFSSGLITVQGYNCCLMGSNNEIFTVSSSAVLTIDGVTMFFGSLGSSPSYLNPIVVSSGGTITFLNDGVIRSSSPEGAFVNNLTYDLASSSGDNLLQKNHTLSASSTITFSNATVGTPKAITLDGQGYFIQFNGSTGQYMTLAENTTVTLKNMLLKDFDFSLINFQGSGDTTAKLLFGDNCTVSLNKDMFFPYWGATLFNAIGNVTINGNGCTIIAVGPHDLTIDNSGKTLTLKNMQLLTPWDGNSIACLNAGSTIKLQNVTWMYGRFGFGFGVGNIEIQDNVTLGGCHLDSQEPFWFSSAGYIHVLPNSSLKFSKNSFFVYYPDTTGDTEEARQKHFKLMDSTSIWHLDNVRIHTIGGMRLDYGQVFIEGKVTFKDGIAFGTALKVDIAPAAILNIQGGPLCYFETTNP